MAVTYAWEDVGFSYPPLLRIYFEKQSIELTSCSSLRPLALVAVANSSSLEETTVDDGSVLVMKDEVKRKRPSSYVRVGTGFQSNDDRRRLRQHSMISWDKLKKNVVTRPLTCIGWAKPCLTVKVRISMAMC